jgi:hypothetical protein
MNTSNSYNYSLSRFLSPALLDALAANDKESINEVSRQLANCGLVQSASATLKDALELCYTHLFENYKNEYIYRNMVFQNLVMKNHTFENCISIPEFRVGLSKADLAVFNGTSTAYEIKTELDSTTRLESQLADYSKFFDFIYVVTYLGFLKTAEKMIPNHVGIYLRNEKGDFEVYREAISNKANISHETLMASLRKPEYTSIIQSEYGFVPNVPNTKYYSECQILFEKLDIEVVHRNVVKILQSRQIKQNQIEMIEAFPESLKSLSLTKRYSKEECDSIIKNLHEKIAS